MVVGTNLHKFAKIIHTNNSIFKVFLLVCTTTFCALNLNLHTSSSDGLGRTGTFIAIWSLIEQMKAEGQIDVVDTIKSIRTQRPGAVPHLVRTSDLHMMSASP